MIVSIRDDFEMICVVIIHPEGIHKLSIVNCQLNSLLHCDLSG